MLARWIDTGAGAGEVFRADTTAPTLSVAVDGENAGTRVLRIGTLDVGSGIDPSSLAVCRVGEAGACTEIPAPPAVGGGTVEVALPELEDAVELRVSVLDRAGNRTEVSRTIEALRGAFGQGAPSGDGDTAGDEPDSEGSGDGEDATDSDRDDDGCGCQAHGNRSAGWLLLLLLVLGFAARRRSPRTT